MAIQNPIPERRRPKILTWVMGFCAVGACVNFIGLAVALHQIGGQASEGQKARQTQQLRQPVALKVYRDAWARGVISDADLACFRDSALCARP